MNWKLVDISPEATDNAWGEFRQHKSFIVFHNVLVKRLESLRDTLENATDDEVIKTQAIIGEVRRQLQQLHEKDTKDTRKDYETTP